MKCPRKNLFGFWLSVLSVTISTSKAPFLTPNLPGVLVSVSDPRNGNGNKNGNIMADNPLGSDPGYSDSAFLADADNADYGIDGGNSFSTAPETPALTQNDIAAGNTGFKFNFGPIPTSEQLNSTGSNNIQDSTFNPFEVDNFQAGGTRDTINANTLTPSNGQNTGFSLSGFLTNAGSALGIAAVTAAKVAPLFGVQQSEQVAQEQAAAQPVNNTWIYIGVAAIVVILIIQKENG